MTRVRRVVLVLSAGHLMACGSGGGRALDGPDARMPEASAEDALATADGPYVSKAPHCTRIGEPDAETPDPADGGDDASPDVLALPQVLDLGGPTLNQPTLVAVTFAGDTFADEIEDYIASVGCTDYWHSVTAEYGIGNAVAATPVRLAQAAPATITDTQIETWLVRKIEGGDPQFPRPNPQTIFVIFYPDSTTVTMPAGAPGTSCVDFGGYHTATALSDGTPLSYAIVARCPSFTSSFPVSDPQRALLATVTSSASHEIVEVSTDPQPLMNPAYGQPDFNHLPWFLGGASELADMCAQQTGASFQPQGYPWYVARAWSNHSASLGANPCEPSETSHYFYAAPVLPDSLPVRIGGVVVTAPTVQIPVSGTATIDVLVTSNFSSGPIAVGAVDGAEFAGGSPHLRLTLDRSGGLPGDRLHLTIQKQSADANAGAEAFVLISTVGAVDTLFWGMTSE
jgi:hypothetical protein